MAGKRRVWAVLAAGVALVLAGCASGGKQEDAEGPDGKPVKIARVTSKSQNVGPCPLMGVLYDASRVVEFKNNEEAFANVGFTGEMRNVSGLCRYVGDKPITMNLTIDMALGRGPAATGDKHTYRYWVAVARRDVAPIFKQYYEVDVDFPGSADRVDVRQEVKTITIPRANPDTSGVNFEILVGFDLTPEQLAFNRDGKRFRPDVGG
jgi:hypothetical protein